MGEVVLVHGAWHGAWCWDGVVRALTDRQVGVTAVELPFTGFADDVAASRAAVVAAGPGAVVCAHSYGGVVVNEAIQGLDNVKHVVYISALVNTGDPSVPMNATGRLVEGFMADGDLSGFNPDYAHDIFYNDSDAATAAEAASRLRSMVMQPEIFMDPQLERDTPPSTYVVCTNDHAVSPEGQRAMAAPSETIVEWPVDHSPFLTRPADIAELLAAHTQPRAFPTTETNESISPG
jgi:pimeloyl-ACP methyl ester carboxylesterase